MAYKTKVEWADSSWSPISGCTPISLGCQRCYARALINRYKGKKGWPDSPDDVTFFPERLDIPKKWKEPKRIFVCSMSDFFHTCVKPGWQNRILQTIKECPQHTFMILTKRAANMYLKGYYGCLNLPNLWVGATVENQEYADKRIPKLLETNAKVKFISVEPMLGPIDITAYPQLDWVICGAETGSGARPMNPDWARSLRDQCTEMNIPFFLKKLSNGTRKLDGRMWEQYPGDL